MEQRSYPITSRMLFTSILTATIVLVPTACSTGGRLPAAAETCPTDYIKVGDTCLSRLPQRPGSWPHAYRTCRQSGDVVAYPETLLRALKEHGSFFEPDEKTFWGGRPSLVGRKPNGRAYVVNRAESENADRVTRVSSPRRAEASHHFRCEKIPGVVPRRGHKETKCEQCAFTFLDPIASILGYLVGGCLGWKIWPG